MKNQFAYPAKVTKDGSLYVVTFRDVGEAITQTDSKEKVLKVALSVLEDVAEVYMEEGRPFPLASARRKGEVLIELPISFSAKVVLHNSMLKNKVRQADIARLLNIPTSEVARIVNPRTKIKIDTLALAIRATGGQIALSCA